MKCGPENGILLVLSTDKTDRTTDKTSKTQALTLVVTTQNCPELIGTMVKTNFKTDQKMIFLNNSVSISFN